MNELFLDGVVAVDLTYYIPDFRAVCPDVLDCRGTGFTRDIGQVFRAPESVFRCPFAEIIEDYAGSYRYKYLIVRRIHRIVFRENVYEFYGGVKNRSAEISAEKQVASAADVLYRLRKCIEIYVNEIRDRIIFDESVTFYPHPECIVCREILVCRLLDHQ